MNDPWETTWAAHKRLKQLERRILGNTVRKQRELSEFFASPMSWTYSLEEIVYGMGDPSEMALWLKFYGEFLSSFEDLSDGEKDEFDEALRRP